MNKLLIVVPAAIVLARAPQGLIGILLVLAVAVAGLAALSLLACRLWPARIERSRRALERFPLRSFLLGVLLVLGELYLALQLPALTLVAVIANLALLAQGFPALAARVGQGSVARGTATMGLVLGLPVLGWLAGGCLGLTALGAPLAGEA